jgi:rubrerythrin
MMLLRNVKNGKEVAGFLYCSSNLEERTFSLYRSIASKTKNLLARSSLYYIAYDSLKHSVIMREIAETISPSKPKTGDCEKKLKQVWQKISDLSDEVTEKQKLNESDLPDLMNRLAGFENSLSEEYFVLVELKTFDFMSKEISQIYKVNLESVKYVFELIAKDEENHREILLSLEELFKKEPFKNNTPIVRYQHPNAW